MLHIKNLDFGYAESMILHDVNLSFEPGNIYTIVGKNGCGKSTLLKCCTGLAETNNSVSLFGKYIESYTATERARLISYHSQSRNTPNITAERLVMHSRFPHLNTRKKLADMDWDIVDNAMEHMHVKHLASKPLKLLSGGEQQRVYLAMLLAQDTPTMLLDEPTTYMDIEYQLIFLELLKDLKSQGKTIIMVLHDLKQALHFSDRIIVMDGGKIVGNGTSESIHKEKILSDVFNIDVYSSTYDFSLKKNHTVH